MSPQYQRLVWKEYRSLAPFWLALLAAHAVICISTALLLDPAAPLSVFLTSVATVVCAGFAVGSTVLSFSGEEDHGTAIWLRMMPAGRTTLISAKVSIITLGTLTLVLACVAVNKPLNFLWKGATQINHHGMTTGEASCLALAGLVGFTGCLLCSLRAKRVMTAFIQATVLLMLLFGLVGSALNRNAADQTSWILASLLVVSVVLVLREAWQWQLRPHRSVLPGRQIDWSGSFSLLAASRRGLKSISTRRLAWASTRPTVASRTTAVLCWQEGGRAILFATVVLTACLVLFVAQEILRGPLVPAELLLVLVVMEAGLRSCRQDQQQLNGLFWSYRGVSPVRVWLVRNAVWLPMLVVVLLAMAVLEFLFSATFESLIEHGFWRHSFRETPLLVKLHTGGVELRPESLLQGYGLLLSRLLTAIIGVFSVCQLCSCWIRKPLVATFAAILAVVLLLSWLAYLLVFQMPLLLLAWPLILFFVFAIPATSRQWMDRRTGVLLQIQRWGSVVAAGAFISFMSQVWWAFEIPATGSSGRLNASQSAEFYASFGYRVFNESGEWPDAWSRLQKQAPGGSPSSVSESMTEERELLRQQGLSAIDDVMSQLESRQRQLPPASRVPRAGVSRPENAVTMHLLYEARRLGEEGLVTESFGRLVQAVKFNRFLMSQSTTWQLWLRCLHHERQALQAIRETAGRDTVSEEQLAALQTDLERPEDRSEFGTIGVNRFVILDQLLKRRGYLWDWYLQHPDIIDLDVDFRALSWSERMRLQRLNDLLSDRSVLRSSEEFMAWVENDKVAMHLFDELHAYSQRPHQQPDSFQFEKYQELIAARRATRTVIALQQYRRRHRSFPATLSDLAEVGVAADDPCLRDPWLDIELGFAAAGFGHSLAMQTLEASLQFISPQQPLLWCHGPVGAHQRRDLRKPDGLHERPLEPDQVVWMTGADRWYAVLKMHELRREIQTARERLSESPDAAEESTTQPFESFRF